MGVIYQLAWVRPVVTCLLLVTPCHFARAGETAPLPVGKAVLTAVPSDLFDWESGEPVPAADLHRSKNYGISDPPGIATPGQPMVLLALGNQRVFSAYEAGAVIRGLNESGTGFVEMISSRNGALYRTRLAISDLGEIAALKYADRGFDPRRMTPMLSAYTAARQLPALDTLPPRAAFEIEIWLAANGRTMRGVKWLDGFLDLFVDVTSLRYAECAQPEASPLAFINKLATRYLQVAKSARQPETIDELPVEDLEEFLALYPYPNTHRFPLGELEFSDRAFGRALRLMTQGTHLNLASEGVSSAFLDAEGREKTGHLERYKRIVLGSGPAGFSWKRKDDTLPGFQEIEPGMPSGDRALTLASRCPVCVATNRPDVLRQSLAALWELSPWFAIRAWEGSVATLAHYSRDKKNLEVGVVLESFASEHLYQPENRFITLLNRHAFFYGQHLRANVSQPRLAPVFALRPEFRIYARRPGCFLNAGWLAMHHPSFVADMIKAERRLRDKGRALARLDDPPADALLRFEELRAQRRARPWIGYEKQSALIHELLHEICINREQIRLSTVGFDYLIDPMILDFRPGLANPIVAAAATSPQQMPHLLLDVLTDCRGATPGQIKEKLESLEARAERGNWNAQGERAIQYHRSRLRKYGDPLIRLNPSLADRKSILIPDETK